MAEPEEEIAKSFEVFLEGLTPDDFVRNTSTAFHELPYPPKASFNDFIQSNLELVRYAYAACDGELFPIIAARSLKRVHFLKANDGETLGQFCERASCTAQLLGANSVFFHKRLELETEPAVTSEFVYWLAGERRSSEVKYRQGYVKSLGQTLSKPVEAAVTSELVIPASLRSLLQ